MRSKTKVFAFKSDDMHKKVIRRQVAPAEQKSEEGGAFTRFLNRTTISALCQMNMAKYKAEKITWLILFLIGFVMATYQSYLIIGGFLKFSVLQKTNVELQYPVQFPAVTVCSNAPLGIRNLQRFIEKLEDHIQTLKNEGEDTKDVETTLAILQQEAYTDFNRDSDEEVNLKLWNNVQNTILRVLSTLSDTERMEYGIEVSYFLPGCLYGEDDCSSSLFLTNNLHYGNCATFNPGSNIETNTSLTSPTKHTDVLRLLPNIREAKIFNGVMREKSVLVSVHEPGTAPLMNFENTIRVYSKEWVDISVTKTDFTRLPWPYASDCIDTEEPSIQWLNLYHQLRSPYLYSWETCHSSCRQNLSINYCGCYNPISPIRGNMQHIEKFCVLGCEEIPAHEVEKMCGCRHTCRNSEYRTRMTKNTSTFQLRNFINLFKRRVKNDTSVDMSQYDMNVTAGVTVSIGSNYVEVISEEEAIPSASLGGAIGGIFGFWIGLSVMSVTEILFSVFSVFGKFFEKIKLRSR